MDFRKGIKSVLDFPKPGIDFKDITPLMQDGEMFKAVTNEFVNFAKEVEADIVVGPEARGFIFGCPVSAELGIGFIPVRKPGKLPRETVDFSYDLEYGSNTLSIHADSIKEGQKVLIVDDLLATGGTIEATVHLIEQLGGVVVGAAFLIELDELNGREKLEGINVKTLINY